MSEFTYWRVSLINGESLDVEAEEVSIDDKNNLIFHAQQGDEMQPVTGCNGAQWRAFRMIDMLGGEPMHSVHSPQTHFRAQLEPLTD